jgi:hypothetical protein
MNEDVYDLPETDYWFCNVCDRSGEGTAPPCPRPDCPDLRPINMPDAADIEIARRAIRDEVGSQLCFYEIDRRCRVERPDAQHRPCVCQQAAIAALAAVEGCQSGAASPEIGSVPNTAAETDGTNTGGKTTPSHPTGRSAE